MMRVLLNYDKTDDPFKRLRRVMRVVGGLLLLFSLLPLLFTKGWVLSSQRRYVIRDAPNQLTVVEEVYGWHKTGVGYKSEEMRLSDTAESLSEIETGRWTSLSLRTANWRPDANKFQQDSDFKVFWKFSGTTDFTIATRTTELALSITWVGLLGFALLAISCLFYRGQLPRYPR